MEKTKIFNKKNIAKIIYWIIVLGVFFGVSYFTYNKYHCVYLSSRCRETLFYNHYTNTVILFTLFWCVFGFIFKAIFDKTKRILSVIVSLVFIIIFGINAHWYYSISDFYIYLDSVHSGKAPVIYLYPEEETTVNVKLNLDGELTCTYPKYLDEGWDVVASPDGTITGLNGRSYDFLYWEGNFYMIPDLSRGYCVKSEDTAAFLEDSLEKLGLNESEANTFIMYWLPILEKNEYNVITFQTNAYYEAANLDITPKPDTLIRVNMLFYGVDEFVDIEPQDLESVNKTERIGFTVVEWGGEDLLENIR